MKPETSPIIRACNDATDLFQQFRKNISLFFIVHEPEEREQALAAKRFEFNAHPGGREMFEHLEKTLADQPENSFFAGLSVNRRETRIPFLKHALPLLTKKHILAVFFINARDFRDGENPKELLYHLCWKALNMLEQYEESSPEAKTEPLLLSSKDKTKEARDNLLADSFAAFLLALQGQKSSIKKLAKKRCLMSLQSIRCYEAEQYPYPITADEAHIIYEEMIETMNTRLSHINQALQMTNEIDLTYDDGAIRQWNEFARAAQEMAWLGFDKNRILSTAIYTSEDPHVRAMAYLASEMLYLEPVPTINLSTRNPFTEPEVNEHAHLKKCRTLFNDIMEKIDQDGNTDLVLIEVRRQNARLLDGEVSGWCAGALINATAHLKTETKEKKQASQIFEDGIGKLSWNTLNTLGRFIMHQRRQGHKLTPESFEELRPQHPDLEIILDALKKAA